MDRRQMISGVALTALAGYQQALPAQTAGAAQMFFELKTWRLHNSEEGQAKRVSEYLEHGFLPALTRAGAHPVAAFGNLIGPDGPYMTALTHFASLAGMGDTLAKLEQDGEYQKSLEQLSAKPGVPFVRAESSLLRGFATTSEMLAPEGEKKAGRVFEMRTYESQSPAALRLKRGMFEGGEAGVFKRLGMKPVFFGEVVVGDRQPCITYMLSFDSLAERERLWAAFSADPEWKRIRAPQTLSDSEIVGNISNVMLRALPFSPLR